MATSDKRRLVELGRGLTDLGWEVIATSGTARALQAADVAVRDVSEITGLPPMMGGRVKTFTPSIFGGILMRPSSPEDCADAERWSISRFHLVLSSFYDFDRAEWGQQRIACIDIGGPALLRAAAKNHEHVIPLTHPADYALILAALETSNGDPTGVPLRLRRQLAGKVFAKTAAYDRKIAAWMLSGTG